MTTLQDIKVANHKAGRYWFSPATLRFFESRVGKRVHEGPGGIYFVSSEQYRRPLSGGCDPRRYTVRQFNPDTGDIDTVGEFQQWADSHGAHREAKRLAAGS